MLVTPCHTYRSSQAASYNYSCLSDGLVSVIHYCLPMLSASYHAQSLLGSSLDNYPEGIYIIKVLISELQEKQIIGISWSSWISLWGFICEFY